MLELDSDIQAAIDNYCRPENLTVLINQTVAQAVDDAVKEEVRNLFRYNGHGRKAINEAIKQYADEMWGEE